MKHYNKDGKFGIYLPVTLYKGIGVPEEKIELPFMYTEEDEMGEGVFFLGQVYRGKYTQIYQPTSSRKVELIRHQIGGLLCDHISLVGFIVKPNELGTKKIKQLHKYYYESNITDDRPLTELNLYSRRLSKIFGRTVSCNHRYNYLQEGCYPIDLSERLGTSVEHCYNLDLLHSLTDDKLPEDLNSLYQNPLGSTTKGHFLHRQHFQLFILCPNSD